MEGNVSAIQAAGRDPSTAPAPIPSGNDSNVQAVPAPAQQPTPVAQEPVKVTAEQAREFAAELNQRADFNKFQAQVTVDDATNTFVFEIHARESGKLVRQFPPEGILLLAQKLEASGASGILLDNQA